MAPILTFKSKTYPAETVQRAEIINMVESKPLSNILEVTEVPATPVEITFECKQVKKSENSASSFGKVSLLNEVNSTKNVLALIDNGGTVKADANANLPVAKTVSASKNNLLSGDATSDWKREKTYDGSPIYRVMTTAPFDETFVFVLVDLIL